MVGGLSPHGLFWMCRVQRPKLPLTPAPFLVSLIFLSEEQSHYPFFSVMIHARTQNSRSTASMHSLI